MEATIGLAPAAVILTENEYRNEQKAYVSICERCNLDTHRCHFCGENLTHDSYEIRRIYNHYKQRWDRLKRRHYLEDCRPDLVDGSYNGEKIPSGRMV